MPWTWNGRIRYEAALAAACLLTGGMALGGCGQGSGRGETPGIERSDSAQPGEPEKGQAEYAGRLEENSLAQWENSLPEGTPEELTAEAVRGVSVVRDGAPYFAVSYEPRSYKNTFDCWALSVPYQSMAVVDTEAMYDYFHALADLELEPAGDVARERTGLGESSDSIYVAYFGAQTETGGQAAPDKGILYRFGDKNETEYRYVEADGRLWTADADSVERLFTVDPYDCILKVVGVVSVESVSSVEIAFADSRYEMRMEGETFRFGEKPVDSAEFYELYTELMSIFIEDELPAEGAGQGGRELLMTVIYHRNTEEAPEIVQRYYAYDADYASAQVNGTEFFLVDRRALVQLQEKIREAFGA